MKKRPPKWSKLAKVDGTGSPRPQSSIGFSERPADCQSVNRRREARLIGMDRQMEKQGGGEGGQTEKDKEGEGRGGYLTFTSVS
ncbi:hypothetical protein EYF80_043980 [Liparis tanakae]|uniref:Uncharacterized protein n=1 Tax=Liparis tanakae TaxID=230148 RepID=A0A4Z2FY57_9TELE|nr:hypothetical protein EYF80_043980 [Liparis tanakae]